MTQLNRTITNIYNEINTWENTFKFYYFSYQELERLSKTIENMASFIINQELREYVTQDRKNYITEDIINIGLSTRDAVVSHLELKKELVLAEAPGIESRMVTLNETLYNRNCSQAKIDIFFEQLFSDIERRVLTDIRSASTVYQTILLHQYLPNYLVENFLNQIIVCLTYDPVKECVTKVSSSN